MRARVAPAHLQGSSQLRPRPGGVHVETTTTVGCASSTSVRGGRLAASVRGLRVGGDDVVVVRLGTLSSDALHHAELQQVLGGELG